MLKPYFKKDKSTRPLLKPYFKKDKFTLFLGDSLKILDQLPEKSVDLIFADPPYLLSNDGFTVYAGKRVSVNKGDWDKSLGVEEDFNFQLSWIQKCQKLLKPNGTIWISGTYHSIFVCGFALQKLGFNILNDIIWYKPNATPNLSGRYFAASHETLIWASQNKKAKHIFNYQNLKDSEWGNDSFKKPGKQMRSLWSISSPRATEKKSGKHPTQKPLDLLRRIILSSTEENAVILDPFTGSSTTGIAAIQLKRQFIGIDNEEKYIKLSIERFESLSA